MQNIVLIGIWPAFKKDCTPLLYTTGHKSSLYAAMQTEDASFSSLRVSLSLLAGFVKFPAILAIHLFQ